MNIDEFIRSIAGEPPSPEPFEAIGWRVEHPNPERPLDEIDLVFRDARGRSVAVRVGGGVVRPASHDAQAAPVSSLASFELAEDLAASLGCRLVLWEPDDEVMP